MSTTINLEPNELITCDLCKRRYNINVYKRHRNENQCIKRNQYRLPFQSIKQRSVQIGDRIFSVQQSQKTNHIEISSNNREKIKPQILNNNKQKEEKFQRIVPSNNRRRTLEQAKELLERRTKYKPPWIQPRSHQTKNPQSKLNRTNTTVLQNKNSSKNSILPTIKFKNDDLPIKISDRHQQPVLTYSPKLRNSEGPTILKSNRIDQINSPLRTIRKAYTWTRSSKQSANRDVISPLHIPTFCETGSGPSHDQLSIGCNQNYDEDEFERYSPTPPSTPKYQQETIPINTMINRQQTLIRPNTYYKSKRTDQQQNEISIDPSPKPVRRKKSPSIFHLPPIKPSTYSKLKHSPHRNPIPWR